jgi:hypothetical protein
VRTEEHRCDQELIALARETRRLACSISESAIRARLIEIADALSDLASPRRKPD